MNKKINLSKLLVLCFFFCCLSPMLANTVLDAEEKPLKEVLDEFGEKYDVFFSYDKTMVTDITTDFEFIEEEDLDLAITRLLGDVNLSYETFGDKYIVIYQESEEGSKDLTKIKKHFKEIEKIESKGRIKIVSKKKKKTTILSQIAKELAPLTSTLQVFETITGNISDDAGIPLIGANITLKDDPSKGTVADLDGNFTLDVESLPVTLDVSYTGYASKEVTVSSSAPVNIILSLGTALDEIIVVGYGTQKKVDATGAISSIKPEEFNTGVISSPEQLLQGKTSGVQITSDGGEPGGGINVRIRGTSSVRSGNGPLFVVDGVVLGGGAISPAGQNAGSSDAGAGNTSPKNPLNFLNPADIASIDVLKDASATAIYGSRGANGVIIITTKKGKIGRGALTYGASVSTSSITKKLDLLTADQFLDAAEDLGAIRSNIDFGSKTDWQDVIFRNALSHNHNISYGGGSEGSTYRFSLGHTNQQGIVEDSGMKRYSGTMNTNYELFDGKVQISTNLSVANVLDENPQISNDAGFTGDLLSGAWRANPTRPIYEADGVTFAQPDETERNPAAIIAFSDDRTNTLRTLGSISANVFITKGLKYKLNVGVDKSNSERKSAISSELNVPRFRDGGGSATFAEVDAITNLLEHTLSYNKSMGNNTLNLLGGYSYQKFVVGSRFLTAVNFQTTDLNVMINNLEAANFAGSAQTARGGSNKITDELQSFFGRVNYIYNDRLILTATVRADGSSKFGENNRYGVFPSAAVAYKLGDASFVPSAFSDLKLRLGWGITGNQEFGGGNSLSRLRYDSNNQLADASFANPDLKWESTSQLNFGIDFGFLANRLTGSIDLYSKTTQDLLFQTISAQPATQPFVWENLDGEVSNKGIELGLGGEIVNNDNFNWESAVNFSYNKNEVNGLGRTINTGAISGQGLTGAYAQVITDGQPLYTYFIREFEGYDSEGINQFADGGVPVLTGKSPLPDFTYGLSNYFDIGKFNVGLTFTGVSGAWVYNNNANALFIAGALAAGKNTTASLASEGESRLNSNDPSTRFLENGSFFRLQNASLGYTFDTEDSKYFSDLRLSFIGQNLLTFTGYTGQDPEVNVDKSINGVPSFGIDYSAYPRARTLSLNLSVSFK